MTCRAALLMLAGALVSTPVTAQPGLVHIIIATSAGTIEAELDSAHAPVTVTNFLRYVDAHHYDGGHFHRTVTRNNQPQNAVRIEVIQGSVASAQARAGWPPIPLERTNTTGLTHGDNVLSMARAGPNSATSDFFITIGAQPELDFGGKRNPDGEGFAAFGRVVRGADVVRTIHQSPANGQTLSPPVEIIRISRKP